MSFNRLLYWLIRGLGLILVLAALAIGAVRWSLRASLAQLEGRTSLAGLAAPVSIDRDDAGVPTIQATNHLDAMRALGFVHAQERFFQMDLLRRSAAGELAELVGPGVIPLDAHRRRHQLRAAARASVGTLSPGHRAVLDAYTAGVNAGVDALSVRPPEYLLLRQSPRAWNPEDSLLVGFAMFFELQESDGRDDLRRDAVRRALPPAAEAFFFPDGSEWDAAIDQSLIPLPAPPGPDVIDFRGDGRGQASNTTETERGLFPGSNSWGVHGSVTTSGAAIISSDMHLSHSVPNIWFRARVRWTDPDGRARQLLGATLPGVPALIVGSNGDIAWGFTNATLDTSDLVELEFNPANPRQYRTPEGWRELEKITENISVKNAPAFVLEFEKTVWGPVIGGTNGSPKRAVCWIAHHPGAMNLGLVDLGNARSVADALAVAPDCAVPTQNLLVGDRQGHLAWTLVGRVPQRVGFDGRTPVSRADGTRRWNGWLSSPAYPRVEAAAGGRLWTANNRIAGSSNYLALGAFETDLGARARQIRDDLNGLRAPVGEASLLEIHRDDRAVFLGRWQELMLRTLEKPEPGTDPVRWAEVKEKVRRWGGHAATNSVGYRAVRAFRNLAIARLMEPVFARCRAKAEDGTLSFLDDRQEYPAWTLLEQRPAHLLNARFQDYPALLGDCIQSILGDLDKRGVPLAEATWGARNLVRIQHPLAKALPQLGVWLDFPPVQLPGDSHMPRVQGPAFGASERLIVSPGREEQGYFHMPGGQSGHYLSPHFRQGLAAWAGIHPTPLLPGPTAHQLVLAPR